MYKPAPLRPKKTGIIRSRNGCKSCRERRTKCDERKPTCGTCFRLGKPCQAVKTDLKFQVVTTLPSKPEPMRAEQQLQHSPGPLIHSINLIHSLQHTDRDVFYSTYWEDHCLPALHPIFRSVSEPLGFPALKDAILALSSCNLSRIHAEPESSISRAAMGKFTPSLTHLTRSQLYYSSAIKKFNSLTQGDYQDNITRILIILVLFGCIESSMGNFDGFYCHFQGLSAFLIEPRATTGDRFLSALLATWLQVQCLVWWARTYFSSLNVQRQLPVVALPSVLEGSLGSLQERRAVVLTILCESHRLNMKETLRHWKDQVKLQPASLARNLRPHPRTSSPSFSCAVRLEEESKKLDQWVLHLPLSERPLAEGTSPETFAPIIFQSHGAALNFAYHVVARIMQCAAFLHTLPSHDPQHLGHECLHTEPWIRLLLRIARGTDVRTSAIRNNYTIGFSGLLLAASLRCQDHSLGIEIEQWLQTLADVHPTEEGAFPVYQALAVVKAINQQRTAGRNVFGVSQPVDDGGGAPKFRGYNSQMISSLLLHGKWRATGDLFTECVYLDI